MKIPQAYVSAGGKTSVSATAPTKIEARIDMSAEVAGAGLCPDCQKPMIEMTAGPVETLTCMPCRISLPKADPEAVVQEDSVSVNEASAGPSTYLDQ